VGGISGIAVRLRDFGLRREDIPRIARFAYQDACLLTNPRHLDAAELEEVLHGAW
jgi:alcohol dehydrogenase class IV